MSINIKYMHLIRNHEINYAMEIFGDLSKKVLEIGAGTGYQTKILNDNGFEATGIDIASSNYANLQVYPVSTYDGFAIPFPDNSYDIVFSSNVMEHVDKERFSELQAEIKRVLKPGGKVIHIVPSSLWRFWTSVTYYLKIFRKVKKIFYKEKVSAKDNSIDQNTSLGTGKENLLTYVITRLIPPRHGVRGNIFTESYYFSQSYWCALLEKEGWRVETCHSFGLFYSGYSIMNSYLTISTRLQLSRFLGRATNIIILSEKS